MNKTFSVDDTLEMINTFGYVQFDAGKLNDPDQYLLSLVSSFAEPISYFDQPLIMDVVPRDGANPASYAGTAKLDLHTDVSWVSVPPRYVVMMCIDPGDGSGVPLVSDGWKGLADLPRDTIEQLKAQEVTFAAPSHVDHWGCTAPIISQYDARYQIRFRSDLLTEDTTNAIDLFREAIKKHAIQLVISPGSVWIVDNYRVLHGRTEINMSSKRALKRMYALANPGCLESIET